MLNRPSAPSICLSSCLLGKLLLVLYSFTLRKMARLDARAFEELAQAFAARSVSSRVSWGWVSPAGDGPFGRVTGYLQSAPLLVPPARQPAPSEGAVDGGDDDGVLAQPHADWLELHIVHSQTYDTPVLLVQGHGADGELWSAEEVHGHLMLNSPESIEAAAISQAEHPVLRVPFVSVHPCRTAEWMQALLHSTEGVGRSERLDYLSAWWAVLAPFVGTPVSADEARAALPSARRATLPCAEAG